MFRISFTMQWFCLSLILMSFPLANSAEPKCEGKVKNLVAEQATQSIHSPGHPKQYFASDECTYVIATALNSEDYMIQISTFNFLLDDNKKDCNTDYLEVYEGDIASGTLVQKWCGNGEFVHKTRSDTVTLRFKSDDQMEDYGFTIFYSVVEYASVQCMESAGKPLMIDAFPLVESFTGSKTMPRCEWKIQAKDPQQKLLIEIFKASSVSCKDAVFNFYEGDSTNGHVSYQYCSTETPFSEMYLNSDKAVLTFEPTAESQYDPKDDLILKISARSPVYACTATSHATLEVEKDPIMFPLPYQVDRMGKICPVTVLASKESDFLRIDVMGTPEAEATCADKDLVNVNVPRRKKNLKKECDGATSTPVYRQNDTNEIEILPTKADSVVFVRASVVPKVCSGVVNNKQAVRDLVLKEAFPSEGGYPNLGLCKYLISAEKRGDIVSLNITWDLSQLDTDLPGATGDFIKIYDGENEEAPLLFSSKGKPELFEDKVVTVVSGQKDMFFVLETDARITGPAIQAAYFSLPGGSFCPRTSQKIMLGRQYQMIQSPNYPEALPLHQRCIYHLVPENPTDHVVVEVVDANLQTQCENALTVYEGEYTENSTENILGRVCGQDKPTFTLSDSKDVTLLTTSQDALGPGGWKVKVYTRAQQSSQRNGSDRYAQSMSWLLHSAFIFVAVSLRHLF